MATDELPAPTPIRRLPRVQRREQILDAANRAFARGGYTATGLADVAEEAGITRVLLYRHFDSKSDLYRAVLDRAYARLEHQVTADEDGIAALVAAAEADPEGFRLLFRHAGGETEFSDVSDALATTAAEAAHRGLTKVILGGAWNRWAARLVPTVTAEAVLAWLEVGRPDPDTAADRITKAVQGVIDAARPATAR